MGSDDEFYAIRRNITDNRYEIFDYTHSDRYTSEAVICQGTIHEVIAGANLLEKTATGTRSFQYGPDPGGRCPEQVYDDILQEQERGRG